MAESFLTFPSQAIHSRFSFQKFIVSQYEILWRIHWLNSLKLQVIIAGVPSEANRINLHGSRFFIGPVVEIANRQKRHASCWVVPKQIKLHPSLFIKNHMPLLLHGCRPSLFLFANCPPSRGNHHHVRSNCV